MTCFPPFPCASPNPVALSRVGTACPLHDSNAVLQADRRTDWENSALHTIIPSLFPAVFKRSRHYSEALILLPFFPSLCLRSREMWPDGAGAKQLAAMKKILAIGCKRPGRRMRGSAVPVPGVVAQPPGRFRVVRGGGRDGRASSPRSSCLGACAPGSRGQKHAANACAPIARQASRQFLPDGHARGLPGHACQHPRNIALSLFSGQGNRHPFPQATSKSVSAFHCYPPGEGE